MNMAPATHTPAVSVIMPAFNTASYIETSVRSVLDQTYRDIEVLIVDDCSTDDTAAVAGRLAASDQRVRLLTMPHNSGPGAVRDFGMSHARGDMMLFVDSDDIIRRDTVELCRRVATEDGAEVVKFNYLTFTDGDEPPADTPQPGLLSAESKLYCGREIDNPLLRQFSTAGPFGVAGDDIGSGWCMVHRRFHDAGIRHVTDRTLPCEDGIYSFDCMSRSRRVAYIGETLYYYRLNGMSLTHRPDLDIAGRLARMCALMEQRIADATDPDDGSPRFGSTERLRAPGAFIDRMRGMQKNILLSPALSSAEKRRWLREASHHPYVREIVKRYPVHRLPFRHRLLFNLFRHNLYTPLHMLLALQARI